jgi:hypothetical protein
MLQKQQKHRASTVQGWLAKTQEMRETIPRNERDESQCRAQAGCSMLMDKSEGQAAGQNHDDFWCDHSKKEPVLSALLAAFTEKIKK